MSGWLTTNSHSIWEKPSQFYSKLKITCNNKQIHSTDSVTYLGAELDQSLSGEAMGSKIIKKASSRLRYLYRKGKYLTSHAKKLLASALIQCHFDYASSFWYAGLTQKTKSKLQVSPNQIIQFILNLPQRAHIEQMSLFKSTGCLFTLGLIISNWYICLKLLIT